MDSCDMQGDTQVVTKTVNKKVRTLADLVVACDIDTDTWDIERWTCAKWEVALKPETEKGAPLVPVVQELFQVKVWLKRKSVQDNTLKTLHEGLLADIREELRIAGPEGVLIPKYPFVDGGYLFEFAPFDLHMGKYTWDEETPTNYDAQIAEDLFRASLEFLLEKAQALTGGKIARILCVFGNDVSHVDGKKGQTTAGTPMDVDTRYIKVYRRICAVHRWAMDRCLEVAPVDTVIVPGNHDELTSFHLGEILATRYETNPLVTVDNSARLRKYYSYGQNLFGFTHGDSEKVSELPLAMAREVPELWAKCNSREFHIGHKHISEKFGTNDRPGQFLQDFTSDKGIRVRRLTSLSGHDAWHTKHAYMDRRACEGFVFHKDAGFTGHLSFNVDHFTGKPAGGGRI